jgi:CheY-like chemotaxis protein
MARILIADDEEHILEVMMDVLEGAGHDVVGVTDGSEALEQFKTKTFDLVLLDVVMPKLDGYHAAQKIRGFPRPPKIVIVTSRDYDGDKHALQAAGADAYLPKPFANKDLVAVVENLLSGKSS